MSSVSQPDGFHKIYVPDNSEVKINHKFNDVPYSKVSRLNTKYSKESMDLFDIVCDISKPARDLFINIKLNMNWMTNESLISKTETRSESNVRSKAVKELRERGVVRKVRGNLFMISPFHLVPDPGDKQTAAMDKWRNLE